MVQALGKAEGVFKTNQKTNFSILTQIFILLFIKLEREKQFFMPIRLI